MWHAYALQLSGDLLTRVDIYLHRALELGGGGAIGLDGLNET